MDHRLPRLTLCALLALLALPVTSSAQEDSGYKPVEAQYLADNLPQFWATGLAFLDTVTKPVVQVKQKVGKKVYLQFETKTLGRCYVDAALGERLDLIAPGQDLIFTATVLHQKRGFFSFGGGPQYFVAVINVQPALGSVTSLPDQIPGFALPATSPDARVLANVDELLKGLQTEIAVLARERGIPAWELMAPGSTNRTDVEMVVTRGVNALADTMSVEPHDVLGQMLLAIMAARVQPNQPAAATPVAPPLAATTPPTAALVPAAEPADVVVTKPAREPTPESPQPAASGVIEPSVEIAGAAAPVVMEEEQAKQARAKADEEKRARAEAEQTAAAKAEQEKLAKAEQKRLAREKAAQDEAAQEAAEKAAAEKAAQEKKARAEQQRLERERLAAEKKAAAEQARLAEEQAEREADARAAAAKAEKKRLAEELKARDEAARAAAKAAAEAPKMRASTTVDAATGAVMAEPKSAQPSVKLQPKPATTTPKPVVPAAGEDDPNAPVPL